MLTPYEAYKIVISDRDRINRSEFSFYTLYSSLFHLVIITIIFSIYWATENNSIVSKFYYIAWAVIIFLALLLILSAILQITSAFKRGHDLGLSGLIIFPFIVIFGIFALLALMLIPGSKKSNSYGPPLREVAHDETFS